MAPVKIVMDGAAWLTSSIILQTREKWVSAQLANPNIFPNKEQATREIMLNQVYSLANTKPEPKKKKK